MPINIIIIIRDGGRERDIEKQTDRHSYFENNNNNNNNNNEKEVEPARTTEEKLFP